MTAKRPEPFFYIDGPGPFAPLPELLAWRDECRAMLAEQPGHPQWLDELWDVEDAILNRKSFPG